MKLLADLFPVLLFFVAYKVGESNPQVAADSATRWFGDLASSGAIAAAQAPILWATLLAIVASLAQVGWRLLRRQRVEPMTWLSLAIIVVFGGATIWFQNETFIKWKPTVLNWAFAAGLLIARHGFGRDLVKSAVGSQLTLPEWAWARLNLLWAGFFIVMGGLNIAVAYSVPTETWVTFKLFGLTGLSLVFVLIQGVWLARHVVEEPAGGRRGAGS